MIIAVLSSITTANRVKRYIKLNYNKDVYIMQTPKALEEVGCGYAVQTENENLELIYEAINVLKVSVKGIYDAKTHKKLN